MIIKSYWANEQEEKQKETFVRNYLKNRKINKFYISDKQIKNFEINLNGYNKGRFTVNYSLKGKNLKYYVSLLNSSFLFLNDYIKVLYDKDWKDYKKGILKKEWAGIKE